MEKFDNIFDALKYYKSLIGEQIMVDIGYNKKEEVNLVNVLGPYNYGKYMNSKLELLCRDKDNHESIHPIILNKQMKSKSK